MKSIYIAIVLLVSASSFSQQIVFNNEVDDHSLVIKELTDADKQELQQAQKTFDTAQAAFRSVKSAIEARYRPSPKEGQWGLWDRSGSCGGKSVTIHSIYAFITDQPPCFINAATFASEPAPPHYQEVSPK